METVHIRLGTLDDNVLLAALGARTFYDAFAADNKPENIAAYIQEAFHPEKQAEELRDPLSVFLIAEIDETPAGYARLLASDPPPGLSGERPVELVRIYAEARWIGHGIGPALMRACIEEARRGGHDTIWLGVWERNPRAIAFYRKWGFEAAGTQTFQLGDERQTDVVMQRVV